MKHLLARIFVFATLLLTALGMMGTMFLACATSGCSHPGLAGKMADGSLSGCVDWAVQHQDVELEQLCKAGRPLADVLDLFAARQMGMQRDAGADR